MFMTLNDLIFLAQAINSPDTDHHLIIKPEQGEVIACETPKTEKQKYWNAVFRLHRPEWENSDLPLCQVNWREVLGFAHLLIASQNRSQLPYPDFIKAEPDLGVVLSRGENKEIVLTWGKRTAEGVQSLDTIKKTVACDDQIQYNTPIRSFVEKMDTFDKLYNLKTKKVVKYAISPASKLHRKAKRKFLNLNLWLGNTQTQEDGQIEPMYPEMVSLCLENPYKGIDVFGVCFQNHPQSEMFALFMHPAGFDPIRANEPKPDSANSKRKKAKKEKARLAKAKQQAPVETATVEAPTPAPEPEPVAPVATPEPQIVYVEVEAKKPQLTPEQTMQSLLEELLTGEIVQSKTAVFKKAWEKVWQDYRKSDAFKELSEWEKQNLIQSLETIVGEMTGRLSLTLTKRLPAPTVSNAKPLTEVIKNLVKDKPEAQLVEDGEKLVVTVKKDKPVVGLSSLFANKPKKEKAQNFPNQQKGHKIPKHMR